ncbi:hypothetical protein [Candidatus Protofrankia californiensis]|uniref:hypothetical protein n=1 Tax=Candidatus Protofrankia californiensis TaxID=1839754 RepID=UPI0010412783|nr:hypothetical protein [Candidatus Protofrankia californiensis]
MSEYQYYEFLAVDRSLDARQRDELRALSTRAQITSTSLINTYHWGDFRGDPQKLVARYFDAFLYLANWGTRRLMLRLPKRLLDLKTAQSYCLGDAASAWVDGENVILDLSYHNEGDWEDEGGEGWLTSIIPVRAELASGDLRLLYLAWLLTASAGELDDDAVEPPVPPNLSTLTASLRSIADFLRLDEDLLAVAAMASEQVPGDETSEADLVRWVADFSVTEKNTLIMRVLRGDDAHLRVELLRRFHKGAPVSTAGAGKRTVAELLDAAEVRRVERERLAEQQRAQERARRERQAEIARDKRLEALALQEEQAWQRVSMMIDTKKPGEYDNAVTLLTDLRAVSERQGHPEVFEQRFEHLRDQHLRKPSLLQRFDRAGLGTTAGAPN